MKRIPEPELMDNAEQAMAYANADFSEPHEQFIALFRACYPDVSIKGIVLDLGCGPADVSIRFARVFPECEVIAVDGAEYMLSEAAKALQRTGLSDRISLIQARLPGSKLPHSSYGTIISNSLLHHLHNPDALWKTIKQYSSPQTRVFIMDLMRPSSEEMTQTLVEHYASDEPRILQKDFYNSLRAAFTPQEVRQQLEIAGLSEWQVMTVSDRHLVVWNPEPMSF